MTDQKAPVDLDTPHPAEPKPSSKFRFVDKGSNLILEVDFDVKSMVVIGNNPLATPTGAT